MSSRNPLTVHQSGGTPHNLSLILASGSEDQKRAYVATLLSETHATVSLHARAAPDNPQALTLALSTVLRRKGRVLDAMTDSFAALRRHLNPEDRSMLDRLAAARSRLATLSFRGPEKLPPEQYRTELAKLEEEANKLEAAIRRAAARMAC